MEEIEYNWKFALFTFIVLVLGSLLIVTVNSDGKPNMETFTLFAVPFLAFISFAPVGFVEIINKIQKKRNK